ncbi:TIM-barrel domain-containing protein, partial [Bifidobacterium scardovii]
MTIEFTIERDALVWTGDGETLRIEAWGANSVRVRATRNRAFQPVDWALLPCGAPADGEVSVTVSEDGRTATLANGEIVVKAESTHSPLLSAGYETFRCDLSFWNAKGELLFREHSQGGSLLLKARDYAPVSGESFAVTASFSADPKERLYGMGEYQQDVLDLKGCTFELAHRNSQASVPFVVSSKGYGFLWHNPAIGRATFGCNRTEWAAQSTDQIDYWVTAGGTYAQIEAQYADATGHAPAMPEWGMGFWQCKLRYWNQEQLLDVAREFKRREIPLDLIVIDFFHWPHLGDYKFEDEFWPDPEAMVAELDAVGVKLMVSVWPQVSTASENFVGMKRNNYLVSTEAGLNLDMMFEEPCVNYDPTNPGARAFVWDRCRENYWDKGVRAFWLDEAEPEYGVYDFRNYRYHLGSDLNVGNVYPQAYNRGFYEGQLEAGAEGEIVNLTRCAWAGSQRYGSLVWSGDVGSTFADLRSQITCAIHMGMAGIPWFT